MLGAQQLVAFVSTVDAQRAQAFYRDALGLRVISQDEYALVFDANGTPLRVTIAPKVDPAPYTVLGWHVDRIDSVLDGFEKAGIPPLRFDFMNQDARGIWTSPSRAKVVWFNDPDGNVLSLTQF